MASWEMAPLEMSPYPPFDPLSPYCKSKNSSKLPPISQGGHHTQLAKSQSKLQLLQHEFQQKLEREKQSKLMAIYKQQYQDALYRLRTTFSQSVVRREIPHRSPGIKDHLSSGSPTCQRLACEEPDSGWTQVAIGPQGKRSAGVDRACPLRPIERKTSSLSNISNLEAEFSELKCFRTLDPTMWPNAPFRPSPPREPCNYSRGHSRSRDRYLRTSENSQSQLYMSHNSQHKRSPGKKGEEEHWAEDLQEQEDNYSDHFEQEISKKESFIQGRLRKIEEELRQLQIEQDRAEEQEMEEREMRRRGEREIRREEREMRKDREMREKEEREIRREEREMRREEREMRGREDHEMRGREEKREDRREREKARLAEMEREEKHRQRERLKRDSGRIDRYREGHGSSGKANRDRCREAESEDENSDVYASEEYSDHSNPFADYKGVTSQVKSSKVKRSAQRESTDCENSPRDEQAESGQVDDRYSPNPKAKCSYCGRRFVLDRVDTHVEICKKVYKHKRKVYDSAKKRAQGTDMENYQSNRKRVATQKKNWKQKHDAFLRMLRAAQQIELQIFRGTKQSDLPPPLPAENPDYVPCPHCKRRFKAEAAERHIPTCKKLRNRPPPLRR
eukprot:gi/632985962/ref/XP_007909976.1/ PREDICTED: zinc finger C2HC domain-containing protein 1C-like [Callorhinchus milii]